MQWNRRKKWEAVRPGKGLAMSYCRIAIVQNAGNVGMLSGAFTITEAARFASAYAKSAKDSFAIVVAAEAVVTKLTEWCSLEAASREN